LNDLFPIEPINIDKLRCFIKIVNVEILIAKGFPVWKALFFIRSLE